MERALGGRLAYLGSVLFAVLPFFFGIIRRIQTGSDLRLFWMATASALGALAVEAIKGQSRHGLSGIAAITFVVSALFSALTGMVLGATSGPGVWMVAIALGLCWAASVLFRGWASRRA